mgnify:CR=1 FL=1
MNERHVSVRLLSEVIFFCLVVSDIFIFQTNSDARLFFLASLWVAGSFRWQITYKNTMRFALIFLTLVVLEYLSGQTQQHIERTALWTYIFLFIGTVQNIVALWRK